jgi:hypothetical protein
MTASRYSGVIDLINEVVRFDRHQRRQGCLR